MLWLEFWKSKEGIHILVVFFLIKFLVLFNFFLYCCVQNIFKFLALDPTGPGFEGMPPKVKLTKHDAKYVEVLHTDAFSGNMTFLKYFSTKRNNK